MERTNYIEAVEAYSNAIYRVAYQYCNNKSDAEDIVQNTFIKLLQNKRPFTDEEHLRKWLIRVAVNEAKNLNLSAWKKKILPLENISEQPTYTIEEDNSSHLYEAVMKLSPKYRIVVYLYYYEDFSIAEIADILKQKETTIQTQLMRARAKLKEELKEEWKHDE